MTGCSSLHPDIVERVAVLSLLSPIHHRKIAWICPQQSVPPIALYDWNFSVSWLHHFANSYNTEWIVFNESIYSLYWYITRHRLRLPQYIQCQLTRISQPPITHVTPKQLFQYRQGFLQWVIVDVSVIHCTLFVCVTIESSVFVLLGDEDMERQPLGGA